MYDPVCKVPAILLKEKDQKQLKQNESVSKTKLFGANFMQIGL